MFLRNPVRSGFSVYSKMKLRDSSRSYFQFQSSATLVSPLSQVSKHESHHGISSNGNKHKLIKSVLRRRRRMNKRKCASRGSRTLSCAPDSVQLHARRLRHQTADQDSVPCQTSGRNAASTGVSVMWLV